MSDLPLSKEQVEAFNTHFMPYKEEDRVPLVRVFHSAVSGSANPLSWANLNGREDDTYKGVEAYDQEALGRLTTMQIHDIGAAIVYFENSLDRRSNTVPTQEQAKAVLSAAYHTFNERNERGKLVRDIVSKTAAILGIELGGADSLMNPDTYKRLENLNDTYEKAHAKTR